MAFITGKNARIQFGQAPLAYILNATNFNITTHADEIDVTNFESTLDGQTWGDYLTSFKEVQVSMEVIWDTNLNPVIDNIMPGTEDVLFIYPDKNQPTAFEFPDFIVTDMDVSAEVRGVLRYTIRGRGRRGYRFQ